MNYTAWSRHSLVSRADVDKVAALPQLHTTTTTTNLGEMKSRPRAPSPLKHRWMLDMNLRRMFLRL